MELQINDMRKKQISEELSPPEETHETKTLIDKN